MPDGSMDRNWNWIAASYKGPSPDNMCKPYIVYFWALHFSVKTITSIGYGDVAPQQLSEFIICILCMFWGGILWAYVIGNMTQVLGNIDTDELAFRVQYDQLNEMMADKGIHLELRIRVRRYLKESRTILKINKEAEFEEILGDVVGMRLGREVTSQLKYYKYITDVHVFEGLGTDFTVQVTKE